MRRGIEDKKAEMDDGSIERIEMCGLTTQKWWGH